MWDQLGTASAGGRSEERRMNAPRLSSTNTDGAFWGGGEKKSSPGFESSEALQPIGV